MDEILLKANFSKKFDHPEEAKLLRNLEERMFFKETIIWSRQVNVNLGRHISKKSLFLVSLIIRTCPKKLV